MPGSKQDLLCLAIVLHYNVLLTNLGLGKM